MAVTGRNDNNNRYSRGLPKDTEDHKFNVVEDYPKTSENYTRILNVRVLDVLLWFLFVLILVNFVNSQLSICTFLSLSPCTSYAYQLGEFVSTSRNRILGDHLYSHDLFL